MLHSFKYRGLFSKSSIRRYLDDTPDNFDLNHEFLQKLTLVDDKEYQSNQIDGRLWLRELFLSQQSNAIQVPLLSMMILSILLSLTWFIDVLQPRQDIATETRPMYIWVYNACLIFVIFAFNL